MNASSGPVAEVHRRLACCLMLLSGTAAFAETIYKWTDETGKVHYGDGESRPANSKPIAVPQRAPSSAVAASASVNSTNVRTAPETNTNLQRCLSMARTMVDNTTITPAEIRASSRELLGLCPDTAYVCSTYLGHPERNNCKAIPMPASRHITTNNTFR